MQRNRIRSGRFPWVALLLALLAGLACGIGQIAEPLENAVKTVRNKIQTHPASGSIVLVAIDDRSIAEMGALPWSGDRLAALVDRVGGMGASGLHLDTMPTGASPALDQSLSRFRGPITVPARFSIDHVSGNRFNHLPPADIAARGSLVNTNLLVWWDDSVWRQPYGANVGDHLIPSLSASLAGQSAGSESLFPIDYALDLRSIPMISASDLLNGRVSPQQLAGRRVVIARTDFAVEHFSAPGTGLVPGIYLHILGAETLMNGAPVDFGWLFPFLLAGLVGAAILSIRRRSIALVIIGTAFGGIVVGPFVLEQNQFHAAVMPAAIVLLMATLGRLWRSMRRSYQKRGMTNLVTGMPNLQALHMVAETSDHVVVAARIKNYTQIATTLPSQHEKELVEQVVARLKFGTGTSVIYQADEGVFVWIAEDSSEEHAIEQAEGLHALFRSPIVIATRIIDLAVTFGIDPDPSRQVMQRVASALVAADDAAKDGKRWASFNPASLEDAEWTMSLMARLDQAIDNGELWVAYQPKLDCATQRVIGAEALVRWTHPEKGQVYPDQFIGAAERGGRIERLTYFVLDSALAASARVNADVAKGRDFNIAVNLSALLLGNANLVPTVENLLRKHRLPAHLLTLEITETSTIGTDESAITNLERLSEIGVQLSIDDYGTGFSTLEYLRRIPAREIKIDRSFITMLLSSQSDRIMVNSTIQLAHSLGRKVVAEGVETGDILTELARMGCDIVQGYHIGRPAPLTSLIEMLAGEDQRRAA